MDEVAKSISFKCRQCESAAKIAVDDGRLERVYCPACGVSLDAIDAGLMYQTLIERVRDEEARNFIHGLVNGRMGRVPRSNVASDFSDPRWPFVLIAEDDA